MYLAAALPALLVTILIFMDQQITAVIVNRKEHKLKVCTLCLIYFKPIIYWYALINFYSLYKQNSL